MPPPADIVAKEIRCFNCGYNLHMLPVKGRCPECGVDVGHTLHRTPLAWGCSHVDALARAAKLAACLNIAFPLVPLAILVLVIGRNLNEERLAFFMYVWLAVYAALLVFLVVKTTRPPPGQRTGTYRAVLILSGRLGVLAALAPVFIMAAATRYELAWGRFLGYWLLVGCFPGWCVFLWNTGAHLASLCEAAGFRSLVPWSRRTGAVSALGAALLEPLFVALLMLRLGVGEVVLIELAIPLAVAAWAAVAFLVVGLIMSTILLFVLSKRLQELAFLIPPF